MNHLKQAKQSLEKHQKIMLETLNSITIDTHWFRRVFHTFASCFLLYYMLPDEPLITLGKQLLALTCLAIIILLEALRLKGILPTGHFFGLRQYETTRPASYLYFGSAMVMLLVFFPQQIAIPCILCGCFADPIIGEIRMRYTQTLGLIAGFLVCMFLFSITWYTAPLMVIILVSLIGSLAALCGETIKRWWIDDDFLIQMLPALAITFLYLVATTQGLSILPHELIQPSLVFW